MITLQTNQIGLTISDVPLPVGSNLTGYSVSLLIQNPSGVTSSYPMTIAGDNVTANYTTVGTEFVTVGRYSAQIELTKSGNKVYTPIATIIAKANLQ